MSKAQVNKGTRGLQWKMVLIYLLLVLVAMELTGFYLLRSLERYYIGNYAQTLYTQAQMFAGSLQRYVINKPDPAAINSLANDWSGLFGIQVAVLDPGGDVIAAPREKPDWQGKRLTTDEIARAMSGARGERIGRDPDTGERRLFMAVPVEGRGQASGQATEQVSGIVYLSASLENEYRTLADIRNFVLYATGIALLVTAVLGVALARTITGPIEDLTSRAARMALGDFNQSVRIESEDEIGQLGHAFNYLTKRLKGTLGEISDEKRKMEAVLTHMADGLVALAPQGQVMLLNPAAAAMLGLDRTTALGSGAAAWLEDLGLGTVMSQVLSQGETATRQVTLPGEPVRVVRADFAPLFTEQGATSGVVVVLHDVTEQEKLERMRREFVANVSHELRTPLTTIKSYVETLLDGAAADPQVLERFLQVTAEEANRMTRLVADLLDLAQIDSGRVAWHFGPVATGQLAAEVVGTLSVQAEARGVELTGDWPEDLPEVWADRDRLKQVFLNIVANALNHTPSGGQVKIAVADCGGHLEVTIADTGHGIPPADLPRVFERFYRADKARSREMGGTGLGLSIAKEIVQAHGGEIGLTSELGQGTTVRFTVPIAPPPEGGAQA